MLWGCVINRADIIGPALLAPLLVLGGCLAEREPPPEPFPPVTSHWVAPVLETSPVDTAEDAADDPAIWVDRENPSRSLVLATNKDAGLHVYDLDGRQRQFLPAGRINNVDLRSKPWGEGNLTVAVASHRDPSQLVVFTLDHQTRQVAEVRRIDVALTEPYGVCMYQDSDGQPWVILNDKDGTFIQYALQRDYSLAEARRFRTATQPEGCVADDERGVLYLGEEGYGIWRIDADPHAPARLESFATVIASPLTADVEGLALYHKAGRSYLIASSQGSNSYVVFEAPSGRFLTAFHVGHAATVDDASETDGLDVTAVPLPGFPEGLLVVQDGHNLRPRANQNFKYVSWREVAPLLRTAAD